MKYRRYISTQVKYAVTYVLITAVVLLFLNLYTSDLTQKLFYQSKQSVLTEKCLLASDEIAKLEVMNNSTVSALVKQLESLSSTRMIVTDQNGLVIYDSAAISSGGCRRPSGAICSMPMAMAVSGAPASRANSLMM